MEQGMLDAGVKLLQIVGLPTMFCLWFMFRMEKKQDNQLETLNKIAVLLAELNTRQGEGK